MFIHQIPKSLPYLRRLHVSGWIALHDLIRREVYGRPWPPAPAGWLITKWGSKLQKDWLECSLAYIIRLKWKLWKVLQIPLTRTQQSCFKDSWTKCLLKIKSLDCSFFLFLCFSIFYVIGHSLHFLVHCCCGCVALCTMCVRLIMMNKQTGLLPLMKKGRKQEEQGLPVFRVVWELCASCCLCFPFVVCVFVTLHHCFDLRLFVI